MRVLHRLADLDEKRQPLGSRELGLVTIVGDGNPAHQFHDKVRPLRVGRAAVQYPGDVGMVHQGQRLSLSLESGDDFARVHARLDDLERHLALHRFLLLGHINDTEPALTNLLQQLVAADHRAKGFRLKLSRR